jgi:hypothetical protein
MPPRFLRRGPRARQSVEPFVRSLNAPFQDDALSPGANIETLRRGMPAVASLSGFEAFRPAKESGLCVSREIR